MYCIKCGAKLEGTPKFCPHCGQPLAQVSKPGAQQPAPISPPPAIAPVAAPRPRRKARPRWLLVLVVVFIITAASAYLWLGPYRTSQVSKEVILERSVEAMDDLKSYHFSVQVQAMRGQNDTEPIGTFEGDFQAPDKAQWTFSAPDETEFEFVGVGGTVYIKGANEKWEIWEMGGFDATSAGDLAKRPGLFSKAYQDLVQLDDEKIDGDTCYHLRFSVDAQKYLALRQIELEPGDELLAIDVDLWIKKRGYVWLQLKEEAIWSFDGVYGEREVRTSMVKLSDFGKEFNIDARFEKLRE